jgi:hypothetical protein
VAGHYPGCMWSECWRQQGLPSLNRRVQDGSVFSTYLVCVRVGGEQKRKDEFLGGKRYLFFHLSPQNKIFYEDSFKSRGRAVPPDLHIAKPLHILPS